MSSEKMSHNPCFSGQCFAIHRPLCRRKKSRKVTILVLVDSVLQYMTLPKYVSKDLKVRHNPCFSGQCFAIKMDFKKLAEPGKVTILVLVDSVLQYNSISE